MAFIEFVKGFLKIGVLFLTSFISNTYGCIAVFLMGEGRGNIPLQGGPRVGIITETTC
jgi:hypothetical protein